MCLELDDYIGIPRDCLDKLAKTQKIVMDRAQQVALKLLEMERSRVTPSELLDALTRLTEVVHGRKLFILYYLIIFNILVFRIAYFKKYFYL